jgi:hypothetical protein
MLLYFYLQIPSLVVEAIKLMIKMITLLIFVLFEKNNITKFTGKETFIPNETSFAQNFQVKDGKFTCLFIKNSLQFNIDKYEKKISLRIANISLPKLT